MIEYRVVRQTKTGERLVCRCDSPESAFTVRSMYAKHFPGVFYIRHEEVPDREIEVDSGKDNV